jgi:hypothetical protein
MPENVVELVLEKGRLHATQAFLMENINEKDRLIKEKQRERFVTEEKAPEYPELERAEVLQPVKEDWGWAKLDANQMAEYLEAEAQAAHIGKFIHKGSILDLLRQELPTIKTLEWMTTPGDKSKSYPMEVKIHHEGADLLAIHEELAAQHRIFEQKVNYYKAMVKNMVTEENARIANVNADAQAKVNEVNSAKMKEYDTLARTYNGLVTKQTQDFEAKRQREIKELAALRINVHSKFQPLIDEFLEKLGEKKEETKE